MKKFNPGTTVCYKCGSPTFVVINYTKKNQVIMSWFNPHTTDNEQIIADENAIETIEDFYDRKKRIELKTNNRLYEIPLGLDPETVVTLGFTSNAHKQKFLDFLTSDNFEGQLIGEDKPDSIN